MHLDIRVGKTFLSREEKKKKGSGSQLRTAWDILDRGIPKGLF
jgi:hypothetical protein